MSCSQDDFSLDSVNEPNNTERTTLRSSTVSGQFQEVILGDEIDNPFDVENLTNAAANICSKFPIPPTDKLIRFTISSYQEYVDIHLDPTLTVFSYPLNREIIQMGDYYNHMSGGTLTVDAAGGTGYAGEGGASPSPPYLYSLVSADKVISGSYQYSVLEEYNYDITNVSIIAESFIQTSNTVLLNEYLRTMDPGTMTTGCGDPVVPPTVTGGPTGGPSGGPTGGPTGSGPSGSPTGGPTGTGGPEGPPIPDGKKDCLSPCYLVLTLDESTAPASFNWECFCPPPPPPPPVINDCGCPEFSNPRSIAGCVNVENNSTSGIDPVQDVRVTVIDSWTTHWLTGNLRPKRVFTTTTDDNGCWRIDENFGGNVWVTVEFENPDSYERLHLFGPASALAIVPSVWDFLKPISAFSGRFEEAEYKDINTFYPHWGGTDTGTELQRNWGAATVNNQVKQFLANTPDITSPPPSLNILLQPHTGTGAAIMNNLIYEGDPFIDAAIPEVALGLDRTDTEDQAFLTFHELTHACHYMQVGDDWWQVLVEQSLNNSQAPAVVNLPMNIDIVDIQNGILGVNPFSFGDNPWGNGDEPNAGFLAIAESIAINLELSLGGFTAMALENRTFTRGYIPDGLYTDLMDPPTPPGATDTAPDNIDGFTRAQLFQALQVNVTSVPTYRDQLLPQLPAGNTVADFNTLLNFYTR